METTTGPGSSNLASSGLPLGHSVVMPGRLRFRGSPPLPAFRATSRGVPNDITMIATTASSNVVGYPGADGNGHRGW
jgi:hypothetical protein